jgi:hypothetical protein
LIAGLVAYWRGLPNIANGWAEELKKPANVKKLLLYMQRVILDEDLAENLDETQVFFDDTEGERYYIPRSRRDVLDKVPFIWTGNHEGKNCLMDPNAHPSCPQGRLEDLPPFGAGCTQADADGSRIAKRAGGVCVVRPGSGRGPGAIGDPITFSPGPASPTCVPGSLGCGTLCTGYYCIPSPTGFPPDHWDPEDPAHKPTRTTTGATQSLPSLTSCASYTPTRVCNGSGGQVACITSSACADRPTTSCPT